MNYIKLLSIFAISVLCILPVLGADLSASQEKAVAVTKATDIQLIKSSPNISVVTIGESDGSLNWNYDNIYQMWIPHVEYTTTETVISKTSATISDNVISTKLSENTDIKYELYQSKVKETITLKQPAKRIWYEYDIKTIPTYYDYVYYYPNKTESELISSGKMNIWDITNTNGSEIRKGYLDDPQKHTVDVSISNDASFIINNINAIGGFVVKKDSYPTIFYQKPFAKDSDGKIYEMSFVLNSKDKTLDVVGNLDGAKYPIEVDPTGNIVYTYTNIISNKTVVMWIYSAGGGNQSWAVPFGVSSIDIVTVGGGGGGGGVRGGGGGGGGWQTLNALGVKYGDTFTITVGDGGKNGTNYGDTSSHGSNGNISSVYNLTQNLLTSYGGGGGASPFSANGGSCSGNCGGGGAVGNTGVPGNDGGAHYGGHGYDGSSYGAGGGGGINGSAGGNFGIGGDGNSWIGGVGGWGTYLAPDNTTRCYGAGGGGGWDNNASTTSKRGCGDATYGYGTGSGSSAGGSGEPNTGGGGGGGGTSGGSSYAPGGSGANGFVTITYNTSSAFLTSFTTNSTFGLIPLTVAFNDTTNATNVLFSNWSFGDGYYSNTSTRNVTHTYSSGGNYTVSLDVYNTSWHYQEIKQNYILVVNTTSNNWTSNVSTGAFPLVVSFLGNTTNATSWNWSFGDGNYSASENVTYTYYNKGTYNVSLKASNPYHNSTQNGTVIVTDPATTSWDAASKPSNSNGYLTYSITNGYWDNSSYSYAISIYDIDSLLKVTKAITSQNGVETFYFDSSQYPSGYYFAYLSRTLLLPGSEPVILNTPSRIEIANFIVLSGYVFNAENGTPVTANVSINQSATFNNSVANSSGYYTTDPTQFTVNTNLTYNVTKTSYRQFINTWLPQTSKTYTNLNISLIPTNPTFSGASVGGRFLKKPYNTPINGVTVTISNATWSTTNVTNTWGYYRFDNLNSGSQYSIYGTKSGYTISQTYAVTAV